MTLVERARALRRAEDVFAAASTFRQAIGLWRGDPLGGASLGPFLEAEVERLSNARVDAIEECIDAELACGYHQALTFELERLVADHPLRERLWAQRAARALPLRAPGRGAASVQRDPAPPGRGPGRGAGSGAAGPRACDARATRGARLVARPRERRPALGPEEQPPGALRHGAGRGEHRLPGGGRRAHRPDHHPGVHQPPRRVVGAVVGSAGAAADEVLPADRVRQARQRACRIGRLLGHRGLDGGHPRRARRGAAPSGRWCSGMSAGGTVAVLFAATYPERTRALILYGVATALPRATTTTLGRARRPTSSRCWSRLAVPTGAPACCSSEFCPSVEDDPVLREHYARFQRASASPARRRAYVRSLLHMDVRPALPLVSAPTLVLHATRDVGPIPCEAARYMAARIPNAKMVELDSADHLIWLTDALDAMVNEIQDFVQGGVPSDRPARVLATVLCVDIPPGPAEQAAVRHVQRHRGQVVNGEDGVFATFDGPARAIRCAEAIIAEFRRTARPRRVCTAASASWSDTTCVESPCTSHGRWHSWRRRAGSWSHRPSVISSSVRRSPSMTMVRETWMGFPGPGARSWSSAPERAAWSTARRGCHPVPGSGPGAVSCGRWPHGSADRPGCGLRGRRGSGAGPPRVDDCAPAARAPIRCPRLGQGTPAPSSAVITNWGCQDAALGIAGSGGAGGDGRRRCPGRRRTRRPRHQG